MVLWLLSENRSSSSFKSRPVCNDGEIRTVGFMASLSDKIYQNQESGKDPTESICDFNLSISNHLQWGKRNCNNMTWR